MTNLQGSDRLLAAVHESTQLLVILRLGLTPDTLISVSHVNGLLRLLYPPGDGDVRLLQPRYFVLVR